jgi:hypothetical protein
MTDRILAAKVGQAFLPAGRHHQRRFLSHPHRRQECLRHTMLDSFSQALPGLWGDFSLKEKRGHAQAAELEEPTKCATKRKRQSVRRRVGRREKARCHP